MSKLITGGLGLIGAELAHILVNRGEKVIILDKGSDRGNIDDIESKVKVIQGDLGNWPTVFNVVKDNNISHIYHLGTMLSAASEVDPWSSFQVNVVGTYNVLEAARLFHVEKIVFSSSIGTYGLDTGPEINDTTIQRPIRMYGIGKLYCEGLGRFYRSKFGLGFCSIRYPVVIGPSIARPGHWCGPMITNAILGKPYECPVSENTTIPMMYFKDAARAADIVLQVPKENLRMVNYNVAGGTSVISAKDVEQATRRLLPNAVITYISGAVPHIHSSVKHWDDTNARQEWGWYSEYVTIDQVIAALIKEIETHPQRYRF